MESRVEHSHLRYAGHDLLAGTDAHQVCGIMQGAKRDAFFNRRLNLRGDNHTAGEFGTAVQHAVSDRVNHPHIRDHAIFAVRQFL